MDSDTICPISRLPDGLLCEIFLYIRPFNTRYPQTGLIRDLKAFAKTWWSLPAVCRYWRIITLDCPRFWSTILFSHPEFTDILFTRSKNAPLHIEFWDHWTWNGNSVDAETQRFISQVHSIVKHIPHIAELSIGLYGKDVWSLFLQGTTGVKAPMLNSCVLTHEGSITLSNAFLGGHAPRLTRLVLKGIHIPWDSPLLQGQMTHIELHDVRAQSGDDFQLMFDALARMPALRHLALTFAKPKSRTDSTCPRRVVNLLDLLRIELRGPFSCVAYLLRHIVIPIDIYTEIDFGLTRAEQLNSLSNHFLLRCPSTDPERPRLQPPIRALRVRQEAYDGLTVAASTQPQHHLFIPHLTPTCVLYRTQLESIALRFHFPTERAPFVVPILQAFPVNITNTIELVIDNFQPENAEGWYELSAHLMDVEALVVATPRMAFFDAFAGRVTQPYDEAADERDEPVGASGGNLSLARVLFPRMQRFCLDRPRISLVPRNTALVLLNGLIHRECTIGRLPFLCVRGCGEITTAELAELQRHVVEPVIWD
ncbi:hypothetical protein OF83DRAFT_1106176 [Amylostereum chailletii]|nr:hypothetical protein OF83DRAFT_1106176 [Amylostereum chailletii]